MVYVTAVQMSGGVSAMNTVASIRWRNPSDNGTGESTRTALVDWLENNSGIAMVRGQGGDVRVGVVNAKPKHLRTHANGQWTDNLLSPPRF